MSLRLAWNWIHFFSSFVNLAGQQDIKKIIIIKKCLYESEAAKEGMVGSDVEMRKHN